MIRTCRPGDDETSHCRVSNRNIGKINSYQLQVVPKRASSTSSIDSAKKINVFHNNSYTTKGHAKYHCVRQNSNVKAGYSIFSHPWRAGVVLLYSIFSSILIHVAMTHVRMWITRAASADVTLLFLVHV